MVHIEISNIVDFSFVNYPQIFLFAVLSDLLDGKFSQGEGRLFSDFFPDHVDIKIMRLDSLELAHFETILDYFFSKAVGGL